MGIGHWAMGNGHWALGNGLFEEGKRGGGAVLGFHATPLKSGNPFTGVAPQVEHPP
ncbi:MAG: hypothetical protein KME31_07420 [Tolypothrix carrinoi HA7290-LM1]|nr:hypothetical protein [Tolypothrix carrinoi HA7290-LM1]